MTLPLLVVVLPALITCPWCQAFDPTDPRHLGTTHGICPPCREKIERLL